MVVSYLRYPFLLGVFQVEGEELALQLSSPVEEALLNAENSYKAAFRGVETGQATLSISPSPSSKDEAPSASSTTVDVAEFTHRKLNALEPSKEYVTNKDVGAGRQFRLTYRPSKKDQREELYELLNKATQRKATARDDLRQAANNMPVAGSASSSSSSKPAVKAGFLNKKSAAAAPPKWKIWFQRAAVIAPIAKNYILFGGFLFFSHFQGQKLAITPPV